VFFRIYWLILSYNFQSQSFVHLQTKKTEIRRFSPLLESSGNGAVALDEWKAVPDIWRTSAEKYGDKVALVDQYHDPPSTMTYKQVLFFFLVLVLCLST